MKAYIDSSVLLRIILGEANPIKHLKKVTLGISCEIIKVECARVIDRLRLQNALSFDESTSLVAALQQTYAMMELVKITPLLLGMSSQPYPTTVRTLDALHLSSALLWTQSKEEQIVFLTHDSQLATAARSLGFAVDGV